MRAIVQIFKFGGRVVLGRIAFRGFKVILVLLRIVLLRIPCVSVPAELRRALGVIYPWRATIVGIERRERRFLVIGRHKDE